MRDRIADREKLGVDDKTVLEKGVHVNIPFKMLAEDYLEKFEAHRLNPEIGIDAYALDHYSLKDFERILLRLKDYGALITIHGPFMDMSPGSLDPKVLALTRRRFEDMARIAVLFQARAVVCHVGYQWERYGFVRDEWLKRSVETWEWLGELLGKEGVPLNLENVYEQGPQEILELFEALAPMDIGFCLDTGHQSAFGKAGLEEWLECLGPFLKQLHLHDNNGKADEHLGLGKGKVRFDILVSWLKERCQCPPLVTLEPHREEDVLPSLERLRQIWPWPDNLNFTPC